MTIKACFTSKYQIKYFIYFIDFFRLSDTNDVLKTLWIKPCHHRFKSNFVKSVQSTLLIVCTCLLMQARAQETDQHLSIGVYGGLINYQGDLNTSKFSLQQANASYGIFFRKPVNQWLAIRAGFLTGTLEAADANNRADLRPRNLQFTSTVQEFYSAAEIPFFNIEERQFTPYVYGGIALFHFNPWAPDNNGKKTYLQPLSTEGQGLAAYPSKKPYSLTQLALPFGAGIRFAVAEQFHVSIDFSQRKTFTDYMDDVSGDYADKDLLFQAKGQKAVEMAYRGGQSSLGQPLYPAAGDQRGSPSRMDWYYYLGINLEYKLNGNRLFSTRSQRKALSGLRCPGSTLY